MGEKEEKEGGGNWAKKWNSICRLTWLVNRNGRERRRRGGKLVEEGRRVLNPP